MLPLPQPDRDAAVGAQRQRAAGVADRRFGERPTGPHRDAAAVLREAVLEQIEVVAEAVFVGRRADRDGDQSTPSRRPDPTST
jgi:hypothetical protein